MKNFTLIVMGLALMAALPVGAASTSPISVFKKTYEALHSETHAKKAPAAGVAAKGQMKLSEMAKKLKPGVTKTYGWTGKKWVLDDNITYTYDQAGNPLSELSLDSEGGYVNTVYEYDANGKVTFKESKVSRNGVDFSNYKKTEFEYDPILTSLITRRTEWLWMDFGNGLDWQLVGNNYKRTVERNADGNITSVVIAVLFQDIYDPTQRIDIAYGEDGKATTISEQVLNYDYSTQEYFWEQGVLITDIIWENTDGQIFDTEDIFLGNNRIKSAHYEDEDDLSFDVSVDYATDSEAYTVTMKAVMNYEGMGDFEMTGTVTFTPLENDGYLMEGSTSFMGFEMGGYKEELRYDDWGFMTLQYYEESEDDEVYYEKTVGEVEYDAEGLPASYTVSEGYMDSGKEVMEKAFRAEYSDYVDVTASVSGLESADETVRYFNLQGVEVKSPSVGEILIKVVGGKARKIVY